MLGTRPRICVVEGIARISDGMFIQGESDWRKASFADYAARYIKPPLPLAEPKREEIYGPNGAAYYSTCASLFYYLASYGYNPFEVARAAYRQASPLSSGQIVESNSIFAQIPGLTDTVEQEALRSGWDAWVRSFYQ